MADISMTAGTSATITLTTTLGGEIYSLSGILSLQFIAKVNKTDTDAVIIKTLGSGLTVTDAANGIAVLALDPSDTASLTGDPTVLFWQLLVQDSSGNIHPLNSGRMVIAANIGTLTSTTVRKMVVAADSLNNWADMSSIADPDARRDAILTLVAGIDVSDNMNNWRDSVTLAQNTDLAVEDTMENQMADSVAIGIGLAVADTLSMSDAAAVALS